ncbi:MAG: alpha/beta fold hydrolase [Burkholderiaceae bacterium]|nr:MAG: alpha/beta fold hydrolase [Burkholderiaceae bacterium]
MDSSSCPSSWVDGLYSFTWYGSAGAGQSVEKIAAANVAAIRASQPNGPYAILGHSYGGVVAYEMARAMIEEGDIVSSLILLDALEPEIFRKHAAEADQNEVFMSIGKLVSEVIGMNIVIDVKKMAKKKEGKKIDYLIDCIKNSTIDFDENAIRQLYEAYMADVRCYLKYEPQPLGATVSFVLCKATSTIERQPSLPDDYGWARLAKASLRTVEIDADHYSILSRVCPDIISASSMNVPREPDVSCIKRKKKPKPTGKKS